MQSATRPAPSLLAAWLVTGIMSTILLSYLVFCLTQGNTVITPLPETDRVALRTAFYVIAIITFPITNLIRHIQLRLNQTMPLPKADYLGVAKSRYLLTIIVSLSLISSIGSFGFAMFLIGDSLNNLYIFVGMSALGLFLYRPKDQEFDAIVSALAEKTLG